MIVCTEWDQLLLDARGGDLDALGKLVERSSADLMKVAAGVVQGGTRALLPVEEVFSDAIVAVLREIGTLRATNYVGFRYWFASIARNHVRRCIRDRRRHPENGVHGEEGSQDAPPELSPGGQAFLRAAVPRLARSQQVAFVLREGFLLTWRTVGFVLERRGGPAARLIHYRAALRLRDMASAQPEIRCYLEALLV